MKPCHRKKLNWLAEARCSRSGGAEALFAQRNGQGRICVYAALKRPLGWFKDETAKAAAKDLIQAGYEKWALNLRQLLGACVGGGAERPIYTLPVDLAWTPRSGVALIGDAAHLIPLVGLGVNLAMLDAANVVTALCVGADWRNAMHHAELQMGDRARALMADAIDGFSTMLIRAGLKSCKSRHPARPRCLPSYGSGAGWLPFPEIVQVGGEHNRSHAACRTSVCRSLSCASGANCVSTVYEIHRVKRQNLDVH